MASFPACNTMRGAIDATEPYQMLVRRADARPPDIKVCIVTDHGFGDQKLYRILTEDPKFDQVIRLRAKITVTAADGKVRTAAAGVEPSGRARITRDALVAAERHQVAPYCACRVILETQDPPRWLLASGRVPRARPAPVQCSHTAC